MRLTSKRERTEQKDEAILLGAQSKRPAALWANDGQMPEQASQLPRALVLGGDPPKAFLGDKELQKLTTWRPLLDVSEKTLLGALLEMPQQQPERLLVSIFQDGELKCSCEAAVPSDWTWPALGPPNGLVDVAGTVTALRLRQGAAAPEKGTASAAQRDFIPLQVSTYRFHYISHDFTI